MKRRFQDALKRVELGELTAPVMAVAEARWRAEKPAKPAAAGLLDQARWCAAIVSHAARAPSVTA